MLLYHYTAKVHLPRILAAGELTVTESNMSRTREHAGPGVVWLTSKAEPFSGGHGLDGSIADKRAVRFAVDVPQREASKWRNWATRRGIDPAWMQHLARVGGSGSWWVITRPIPAAEWVSVEDTRTGESLLPD